MKQTPKQTLKQTLVGLLVAASVAVFGAPRAICAQSVREGMRVRIVAPPEFETPTVVTILERHGETLRVAVADATPVSLREDAVLRLQVSAGKSRAYGAQTGALWTAAVAAPFALFVPSNDLPTCQGRSSASGCGVATRVLLAVLFASSGAFYGAIGGGIIGRERWKAPGASDDQSALARLSLLPPARGALGLSVRF